MDPGTPAGNPPKLHDKAEGQQQIPCQQFPSENAAVHLQQEQQQHPAFGDAGAGAPHDGEMTPLAVADGASSGATATTTTPFYGGGLQVLGQAVESAVLASPRRVAAAELVFPTSHTGGGGALTPGTGPPLAPPAPPPPPPPPPMNMNPPTAAAPAASILLAPVTLRPSSSRGGGGEGGGGGGGGGQIFCGLPAAAIPPAYSASVPLTQNAGVVLDHGSPVTSLNISVPGQAWAGGDETPLMPARPGVGEIHDARQRWTEGQPGHGPASRQVGSGQGDIGEDRTESERSTPATKRKRLNLHPPSFEIERHGGGKVRKRYSLDFKIKAAKYALSKDPKGQAKGGTVGPRYAAAKLGIPEAQSVREWMKRLPKMEKALDDAQAQGGKSGSQHAKQKRSVSHGRAPLTFGIETQLLSFVEEVKAKGQRPVSSRLVKDKAKELQPGVFGDAPEGNTLAMRRHEGKINSWCHRFLKRHGVTGVSENPLRRRTFGEMVGVAPSQQPANNEKKLPADAADDFGPRQNPSVSASLPVSAATSAVATGGSAGSVSTASSVVNPTVHGTADAGSDTTATDLGAANSGVTLVPLGYPGVVQVPFPLQVQQQLMAESPASAQSLGATALLPASQVSLRIQHQDAGAHHPAVQEATALSEDTAQSPV